MITGFQPFGAAHLVSLVIPILLGVVFILTGRHAKTDKRKRYLRLALAIAIAAIRGTRYVMDVYFGVFEWYDLISLHVCHIDLLLLLACLIRPRRLPFHFVLLIGIPMGLLVALFPGAVHPAPGLPRAMLFIMSHMMLAVGAFYLLIVERMRLSRRIGAAMALAGVLSLPVLYWINRALGTNFLYIMFAPPGTAIETLEQRFGWPGYVLVMAALALSLLACIYGVGTAISRFSEAGGARKAS